MGATYALFFTLTTWSLSYATTALGFTSSEFLLLLMGAIIEFAVLIMLTSVLADRVGRKKSFINCISSTSWLFLGIPIFSYRTT